jgi:hypothetical protein
MTLHLGSVFVICEAKAQAYALAEGRGVLSGAGHRTFYNNHAAHLSGTSQLYFRICRIKGTNSGIYPPLLEPLRAGCAGAAVKRGKSLAGDNGRVCPGTFGQWVAFRRSEAPEKGAAEA